MNDCGLSEFIVRTKYCRYIPEESRRETFPEAVERVMEMHRRRYHKLLSKELLNILEGLIKDKCIMPSMRSLQFGGRAIEEKNIRLYNCVGLHTWSPIKDLSKYFYCLLCGSGVGLGFNSTKTATLPNNWNSTKTSFTIKDSIEGWVEAIEKLLFDLLVHGSISEFDYSEIRPKGALIHTGGGIAPGPEPLERAIENIKKLVIGKTYLKPIDLYDIAMFLSEAVLSGGVRRSATIALFHPDDKDFLEAKTGNWIEDNHQRQFSNNSASLLRHHPDAKQSYNHLFNHLKEYGEPGIYFTNNARYLTNPCAEIGFDPWIKGQAGIQACNLSTINGTKVNSRGDLLELAHYASILSTLQAGYTDFTYPLTDVDRAIVERDALIGVSISGFLDNPKVLLNDYNLSSAAFMVMISNKICAERIGINPAKRTTCVKPDGTVSFVMNTASGIHPHHHGRYLRRIRINNTDPIYEAFRSHNPHMCEPDYNSASGGQIITFPVEAPKGAILQDHLGAVEHLEIVKLVQENWVIPGTRGSKDLTNSVSNTIVVEDKEWEDVRKYIWKYRDKFAGISLLPKVGDKTYKQAVREAIRTPAEHENWEDLRRFYKEPNLNIKEHIDHTNLEGERACVGGACEL